MVKKFMGAVFMKYLAKLIVVLSCSIFLSGYSSVEQLEINYAHNYVDDENVLLDSEIDDLYQGAVAIVEQDLAFASSAIKKDLDEIEEVFLSLGDDISFYYYNIETGFQYGFNSDKAYIGASVGKVFYAYFLYTQDEIENITLTKQERLWVQQVLRTSLDAFSHNLTTHYGVIDYNSWLGEQGIYTLQTPERHFGLPTKLTAGEAASLMDGIYHYFLTKTPNAIEFRENMINNQFPFIVSHSYDVASKTGWLVPQGIRHDVAIVEAPSPYVLVILSQNPKIAQDHLHHFEWLSSLFEDFNNKWFVK